MMLMVIWFQFVILMAVLVIVQAVVGGLFLAKDSVVSCRTDNGILDNRTKLAARRRMHAPPV